VCRDTEIAAVRGHAGEEQSLDVITTTIERKWFAEIVAGGKRIEYRDIKPCSETIVSGS
jgi:hypothetical protein